VSIKGQSVVLSTPTDPQFVHRLSDHVPCRKGWSQPKLYFVLMHLLEF